MKLQLRSMRARMTLVFGLFVAVLTLAGGTVVQRREVRRAERRTHEILSVAKTRAYAELEEIKDPSTTLLQVAREDAGEIAAGGLGLLVVQGDKILWRSDTDTPTWPRVGDNWRVQTLPYRGQLLVLAFRWSVEEDDLRETARSLWELGVFVVIATSIGAWFVVGRTLSPLDRLAEQARKASVDSLEVRLIPPSTDAEMQHLTGTLNEMLGRLEKEARARGRFYAAASHELRTPIQVLLGQIDVARSRPRSTEAHVEILEQLQAETERLATLVQDLLQLNALEMGQNQSSSESLNLAFWVQRALEQQQQAITERELVLETHLQDVEVIAPPAHVEMLLRNLLENATKYSVAGTPLRVALSQEAGGARLSIWNWSQVPEHTPVENWFEPFFRHDASRNSKTGGNGLGLSIVAALARANGWKVELRLENGGVLARVDFSG